MPYDRYAPHQTHAVQPRRGLRLQDITQDSALTPMITIQTTVRIEDNRPLTVEVPDLIPPGDYDLVLVLERKPVFQTLDKPKKLIFADHRFPIPVDQTFTREDMYGENGR